MYRVKPIGGSNPPLSAKNTKKPLILRAFFRLDHFYPHLYPHRYFLLFCSFCMQDAAIRSACHLAIAPDSQATACGPIRIGAGNVRGRWLRLPVQTLKRHVTPVTCRKRLEKSREEKRAERTKSKTESARASTGIPQKQIPSSAKPNGPTSGPLWWRLLSSIIGSRSLAPRAARPTGRPPSATGCGTRRCNRHRVGLQVRRWTWPPPSARRTKKRSDGSALRRAHHRKDDRCKRLTTTTLPSCWTTCTT